MEWGKQMEKHSENAKLSLYQNSNYNFERRERKTLIIDYKIGITITDITLPLYEPLIIDIQFDSNVDARSFVIDIEKIPISPKVPTNLFLYFTPNA